MRSLVMIRKVYRWLKKMGSRISHNSRRYSLVTKSATCWWKSAAMKQTRDAKKWMPVMSVLASADIWT